MSLTTRAVIAIILMVGFYVFSFAVIAGLIWIPYAEWHYLDRIHIKVALACLIAAALIFWSILPRPDRFEEPGPRITSEQHPRLFAELNDIAKRTGQQLPAEVFLVPEVNAWVSQRGGIMGFGSRRVMGLGVPLMRLLTISQFRAVLAHEFGHYCGGDTALGPWIYKTRAAIGRTLEQLAAAESWIFFLFNWYGTMFLRITLAISRAQEYAADRLGAQIGSAKAMIDGLKRIHVGGIAWQSYLRSEVEPVIASGFSPPISQGFHRFLNAETIQKATAEDLQKELANGKADKYDTHPALPERIAALESLPAGGDVEDNRPATDLLEDYEAADTALFLTSPGFSLKPIAWDQVLNHVYIAGWKEQVTQHAEALRGLTMAALGRELHSWELRNRLKLPDGSLPSNEERDEMARAVAGCAIALSLLHRNWLVKTGPGEPVVCSGERGSLKPFETAQRIANDEIKPEQWQEMCATLAIAEYPVDPLVTLAETTTASAGR